MLLFLIIIPCVIKNKILVACMAKPLRPRKKTKNKSDPGAASNSVVCIVLEQF